MVWQRGLLLINFLWAQHWHGPGLSLKSWDSHRHSLSQEELTWSCTSAIWHNAGMSLALRNCLSPEPQEQAVVHHSGLTTYGQGKDFLPVALFTAVLCPHNFNGIALIGFKQVKSEIYLHLFLKVNSREVKEVKRIRDISSKLQVLGWPRKFFGFFPKSYRKPWRNFFSQPKSSLGMTRNGQQHGQYPVSLVSLLQSSSTHVTLGIGWHPWSSKLHVWKYRVLYLYLFTWNTDLLLYYRGARDSKVSPQGEN